jgi:hypothetical protein
MALVLHFGSQRKFRFGGADVFGMTTTGKKIWSKRTLVAIAGILTAAIFALTPMPALAQNDPNPGALTFTGVFDMPTVYVFRGIVQELDPSFTAQPAGDLGIALASGDGGLKSAAVNFGVWHSLQTGSTGSGGPNEKVHYEEDFYATLGLGFNKGISLGTTFTAYTSPNGGFNTVKELSFKVSQASKFNPYGTIAFELSGQADGGSNEGTYLELGVGPSFPLKADGPTLTIPVKFGLSLSDYYEGSGEDHKFGFFDIGAQIGIPIKKIPSQFGSWNVHGGVDFYSFGDTTKAFNDGDSVKVVGLIGFGLSY